MHGFQRVRGAGGAVVAADHITACAAPSQNGAIGRSRHLFSAFQVTQNRASSAAHSARCVGRGLARRRCRDPKLRLPAAHCA